MVYWIQLKFISNVNASSIALSDCPTLHPSVRPFVRLSVCVRKEQYCKFGAKKSHYQSKMFVCVSVISGRMRIIARCGRSAFNIFLGLIVNVGHIQQCSYPNPNPMKSSNPNLVV